MQPIRGIVLKVASVCVFMAMASLIKATASDVPPGEAVFFRSFFAMPVIAIWLIYRKELTTGLRTSNPLGHIWRTLLGTTAMGLGFAGLGLLPLPEVTAIGYASPLLVVVLAAMFLNEPVRLFRLSTVAIGLVGVLIVLSPRLTVSTAAPDLAHTLGAVVVLGGAVFAALAQVFVRKLVLTEQTATIVFWFSALASLFSLVSLPWGWVHPSPMTLTLLILCGILGGVGQVLLTSSYRYADASVIAPFEYTSMILALAIGYLVFGEAPTLVMLGGAMIIMLAGVLIIWREGKLGIARDKQRKAMTPGA